MVKNLPKVQETWVQSLGQEDTLEKEMTTHSSILAWKIPWTEESSGLQSKESDTTELLTHFHIVIIVTTFIIIIFLSLLLMSSFQDP